MTHVQGILPGVEVMVPQCIHQSTHRCSHTHPHTHDRNPLEAVPRVWSFKFTEQLLYTRHTWVQDSAPALRALSSGREGGRRRRHWNSTASAKAAAETEIQRKPGSLTAGLAKETFRKAMFRQGLERWAGFPLNREARASGSGDCNVQRVARRGRLCVEEGDSGGSWHTSRLRGQRQLRGLVPGPGSRRGSGRSLGNRVSVEAAISKQLALPSISDTIFPETLEPKKEGAILFLGPSSGIAVFGGASKHVFARLPGTLRWLGRVTQL